MSEDPEAQSFCMAYGEGQTLQFQLRPSSIVLQHTGPAPVENLTKTVRRALAAPLDFPPLAQAVIPDDRIVIAAEPDTPGLPLIMRELWTVFAGQGVRPEHLTIVQTQSRSDPRELLPEDVRSEVQWLQHSPQDQGSLAYLASTTGGDRIQLARSLTEADVTISVGRLGFDPILGYRGTNSAFYPALSDFDAIDKARGQGHAELQPEDSRPLRQIVDEVGWLLGTQFTLQVVPAADGDVAAVLAGAVEPVFRRGREFLSKQLLLELDERADLVVVSVGTDAGGHGWTQIAAAIAEGNLEQPVRVIDSEDEIGFLARQFERMRRSIQRYVGELVTARQTAEEATQEEQRLRAQIEEHSKLLEIKVQERTAELQEINERLTEYDRMKSEFLSNVSHELRSPLAAIASAAKIIGRYGDENKKTGKKFSTVITDETERLGRLINDLLDLAKIEAGRVEWNMTRVENPVELLFHVVTTFRPLAQERGVELELDSPERLPAVELDRDRMLQVLTNLCSNAMKFTPEGGRIVVSARETLYQGMPSVMVTVQDSGPGIPPDQLEKVFDRFHQVKAQRDGTKPKGTGLGLAICREVVNHHGGAIWAEAPASGGARMVFCLPLADAGKPRAETGPPTAPTHEAV